MKKKILIKYAELNTKKANIGLFLKTLKKNISDALNNENTEITFDKGRMYITPSDNEFDVVIEKLNKVFGIHEYAIGYELPSNDFEELKNTLVEYVKDVEFKTFKVDCKRSDKTYFLNSLEVASKLGGEILRNKEGVKVSVTNPEKIIYVEIRKTNAYFYFETYKGNGGYPVGTLGKGALMISGGIDSPVAGYLAMKRGVKLEAIYFDSPPHTSIEAQNKVRKLVEIIGEYQNGMKLHIIPFTKIQEMIYKEVPKEYIITIMRRMMYRISERIAHKNNCKIIVNGESIGQVASQTLQSMNVINEVVNIPVIRPVACFDKLEIIDVAKRIGTYETSILPFEDCCTIFVPEHPVIYPDVNLARDYEKTFDYETMIYEAIKNEVVVRNVTEIKNEFADLL